MGSEDSGECRKRRRNLLNHFVPFVVGLLIGGAIAAAYGKHPKQKPASDQPSSYAVKHANDNDGESSTRKSRWLKTGGSGHDYPHTYPEKSIEEDVDEDGDYYDYRNPDRDGKDSSFDSSVCPDTKKGKGTVLIVGTGLSSTRALYMEGNVTKYGERYIWYGQPESGICTVIAEANETGFVTQLCSFHYKFTETYASSTLTGEGIYVTNHPDGYVGEGHYTITGTFGLKWG